MLEYSFEVGVCWGICYLLYIIFLSKETYFVLNRSYLLCSLLFGLFIPMIHLPFSYVHLNALSVPDAVFYISEGPSLLVSNLPPNWELKRFINLHLLLAILYGLGVIFMSLRFFIGLNEIFSLFKSAQKVRHKNYVSLETTDVHLPFSFLNCVFLNKELVVQNDFEKILNHELTHVRSWHTLDVLLVEILQIIFWFNPLIYLYKKVIKEVHEYTADAFVLQDTPLQDYTQIIIRQSSLELKTTLANHFLNNHIINRLDMMDKKKSAKPALIKYFLAIPTLLFLLLMFSTSTSGNSIISQIEQPSDISKGVMLPTEIVYPILEAFQDSSHLFFSGGVNQEVLVYPKTPLDKIKGEKIDIAFNSLWKIITNPACNLLFWADGDILDRKELLANRDNYKIAGVGDDKVDKTIFKGAVKYGFVLFTKKRTI